MAMPASANNPRSPQRHHRHPEHDGEDDEWRPALDVGERVAGGGVDVRASVVQHDVVADLQFRYRGARRHVGLQGGEGPLVRPIGDAGAHVVALCLGVEAARADLGCRHCGVDPIAVAEDLTVNHRITPGPPHGESHQRRHHQHGHGAGEQVADRGCI
jgi:hypothetical protein